MKLRDDNALSSVDDERAVVGHQGNLAKEDFFFLDVADRFDVRVRVLVVNREPDLYFQRHAVTHAAFLTLLLIVLVLEAYRLAAIGAKFRPHRVEGAANVTESFTRAQRVDLDPRVATLTSRAQEPQPFKVAALALPVANLIFDKIERRRFAKIRDRKHRFENGLQTRFSRVLPATYPFAEIGYTIRAESRSDSESAPQF